MPTGSILDLLIDQCLVNMHYNGVGILLAEHELVYEGLDFGILTLREPAVTVTALYGESHTVFYSELFQTSRAATHDT